MFYTYFTCVLLLCIIPPCSVDEFYFQCIEDKFRNHQCDCTLNENNPRPQIISLQNLLEELNSKRIPYLNTLKLYNIKQSIDVNFTSARYLGKFDAVQEFILLSVNPKIVNNYFFQIFTNVKYIEILSCNVTDTDITNETFMYMHKLEKVIIKHNSFKIVYDGVFKNLTFLKELDLSSNKIIEIKENSFNDTINLSKIDISNNNIELIQQKLFHKLNVLESLYLQHNRIKVLDLLFSINNNIILRNGTIQYNPQNCFGEMQNMTIQQTNITMLLYCNCSESDDLKNKEIIEINTTDFARNTESSIVLGDESYIDCDTFKNMHNLETVTIKNNSIKTIYYDVFKNLTFLQNLDLSWNKINEIKENSFYNNTNLSYLNLSSNELKSIPKNLLSKTVNLKVIDISNNHIELIPNELFLKLYVLESLYLQHNHIKVLYLSFSININNILQEEKFKYNPQNCSGEMKNMTIQLINHNTLLLRANSELYLIVLVAVIIVLIFAILYFSYDYKNYNCRIRNNRPEQDQFHLVSVHISDNNDAKQG